MDLDKLEDNKVGNKDSTEIRGNYIPAEDLSCCILVGLSCQCGRPGLTGRAFL